MRKKLLLIALALLSASAQAATVEDSLKQKARAFLVEHGPRHWARKSESMDKYLNVLKDFNRRYTYPESWERLKSFVESNSLPVGRDWTDVVYDSKLLTPAFLDRQVDRAFRWWRDGKYARHLTYEDFCEYLLPYRFCNEQLEDYFDELEAQYAPFLQELDSNATKSGSAYWAAERLGEEINRRMGCHLGTLLMLEPLDLPYSALKEMRQGVESDYALLTAMVLRACGVPSAIDFAPWPQYSDSVRGRRSYSFTWNSVLDNTGRTVPFHGGLGGPHSHRLHLGPIAKVYRYTFAWQPQSLTAQNEQFGDTLPAMISSPFIRDVTNEYMATTDVKVHLNGIHAEHFAYLSVYRGDHSSVGDRDWCPVAFAPIGDDHSATFSQMGRGVVYLPCLKSGSDLFHVKIAGYPIAVEPDRNVQQLKPADGQQKVQAIINQMPDWADQMVSVGDAIAYQLYYYGENGEEDLGRVRSADGKLLLSSLPAGALFRLCRLTPLSSGRIREVSRLFTVKDGIVRWY